MSKKPATSGLFHELHICYSKGQKPCRTSLALISPSPELGGDLTQRWGSRTQLLLLLLLRCAGLEGFALGDFEPISVKHWYFPAGLNFFKKSNIDKYPNCGI